MSSKQNPVDMEIDFLLLSVFVRSSSSKKKYVLFLSVFLYFHIPSKQPVTYWTKFFEKYNANLYVAVYLTRTWTFKNADENAYILTCRSKNVKKDERHTNTMHNPRLCSPLL